MSEENNTKHNIEISDELYQAVQQLKEVLQQMTGKEIKSDEEVIWILVSWFIESIMSQQWGQDWSQWQWWNQSSQIIS